MPMGEGQKRYLVLAREDLTNQVEGRALTNKTTAALCRFLIEDVICRYGCVGKIVADPGELDAGEAEELFDRLGVKLSLTTAYNPEANGKIERGHDPIVKAMVRACEGRVGNWPRLLPYAVVEIFVHRRKHEQREQNRGVHRCTCTHSSCNILVIG